ncbi:DUF4178 domain-containing protein [bacterium]|nr:DUF4178 domain-containing protein [bacterium]
MQSQCPSCGNTLNYKSELSAYVVCSACQTLVARKNMQFEAVGKVAALQSDASLIKLGTQGTFDGKSFEVVGRIQMILGKPDRPDAVWNEWFAVFSNGAGGWLGEHLGEYFVSFVRPAEGAPGSSQIQLGQMLGLDKQRAVVTSVSRGTALTFEGELPFVMDTSYEAVFADLSTTTGVAGTLDYSDDSPLLFQGRWCRFEELKFQGLRLGDEEGQGAQLSAANLKTLKCPTCGAPHEIRAGGLSQTLVCQYCDSGIDLNADATFRDVLKFEQAMGKVPAKVPLGSKGKLPGQDKTFTCIGFMAKATVVDGIRYKWGEYLLYEPTRGYQWLTESNGHWSLLQPLHKVPVNPQGMPVGQPTNSQLALEGKTFKHFQSTHASVDYVAGEFYWRVRAGEGSQVVDYVCPPEVLSADSTQEEINWTRGQYVQASEVWKAFGLQGSPPESRGVANNQPNPYYAASSRRWLIYLLAVVAGFLFMLFRAATTPKLCFTGNWDYLDYQADRVQVANVTVPPGRHNLYISVHANGLDQRWGYFLISLIDEKGQQARDTAVQVYQERGSDDEGPWADSVNEAGAHLSGVQGGEYLLRVEPQSNVQGQDQPEVMGPPNPNPRRLFSYMLTIQPDLPQWGSFWMMVMLGLLPPLYSLWRASNFETRRWSESDHAPGSDE